MVNWKFVYLTVGLFIVEVCIALYVHDTIVRPFFGDVLVVVLLYCAARIFVHRHPRRLALGVLFFACTIEVLQYFDFVKLLHLEQNRVLSVALGRTFAWDDFLAYATGYAAIRLSLRGE